MNPEAIVWILRVALCAISVLALLVNSLLLRWITRLRQPRFSRLNHFLSSTALGNLVTALAIVPLCVFVLFYERDTSEERLEEVSDIFYCSFDVFHGLLASLNLVLIAAERFYAAHWPLYHRVASDRPHYVASVLVWLATSCLASMALMIHHYFRPPFMEVIISIVCFTVPLLLTVLLTLKTACLKWTLPLITPAQKNDVKVAVRMAFVFLSFAVTCLPFHLVHLITYFTKGRVQFDIIIIMVLRCLFYGSSVICPIVIIVAIPAMREKLAWCWFKFYAVNDRRRHSDMNVRDILETASSRSSTCNLGRANGQPPRDETKLPGVYYI